MDTAAYDYRAVWRAKRLSLYRRRLLLTVVALLVVGLALFLRWPRDHVELIWQFDLGHAGTPRLALRGKTLYVAWEQGRVDALHARRGHTQWPGPAQLPFSTKSEPAASAEALIVGAEDGGIRALDALDGHQLWEYRTTGPVEAQPVVVGGAVYVGTDDGLLYALNARTGLPLWRFEGSPNGPPGGGSDTAPPGPRAPIAAAVAADDRRIFVASLDHCVYALNRATGRPVWARPYKADAPIYVPPLLVADTLIVGSDNGILHFLGAADGRALGLSRGRGPIRRPLCSDGRIVYWCANDDTIYASALPSRTLLWAHRYSGSMTVGPLLCGAALVYGTADGDLVLLQRSSGRRLWHQRTGWPLTDGLVGRSGPAAGLLFLAGRDGIVRTIALPPAGRRTS